MATKEYPTESTADIDLTVPYCLGIDEAGRGPVLGAMVYGICYYPVSDDKLVRKMGFADSKTLTEAQREALFHKIVENSKHAIRYATAILSPQELSYKMLRINKYNLNWISHDAAIGLIRKVLAKGVNVAEVYVDTVGDPAKYQGKLANLFPHIPKIVVSKKADSIYPVVSAASICAKVIRDVNLKNWVFTEQDVAFSNNFGSGYPGDPVTKKWLKATVDPVFGYPSVIRFSWKTCSALLEANAVQVTWRGDDEEEDEEPWRDKKRKSPKSKPRTSNKMRKVGLFAKPTSNRFRYFADNGMEVVTQL